MQSKVNPIKIGDLFAKPIPDGRYGLYRIVNKVEKDWQKKKFGDNSFMVAVCQCLFKNLPSINELDPQKNLYVNNLQGKEHHIITFYNREDIPGDIIYVGNIPLSHEEEKRFKGSLINGNLKRNHWEKYTGTNTDEIREFQSKQPDKANKIFNKQDLELLLKGKPFNISGFDEELKTKVTNILFDLVRSVLAFESQPSAEEVAKILREGILKLNMLNEEHGNFIGTLERENIMLFIDEICEAVALPEFDDKDRTW